MPSLFRFYYDFVRDVEDAVPYKGVICFVRSRKPFVIS